LTRTYLSADASVRRFVLSNVHALAATVLIVGGVAAASLTVVFFAVNIAHESAEAVAAAREAVLEGSAGGSGFGGFTRRIKRADVDGRWQTAWSSAVETHWPRALRFAQNTLEEAFPESNATEVWEAMQDVYAKARDAVSGSEGSGPREMDGPRLESSEWALVVKRAGKSLGDGDIAGAFGFFRDAFGSSFVSSDASMKEPSRVLRKVSSAATEALRSRTTAILSGGAKSFSALLSLLSFFLANAFGVAEGVAGFLLKLTVFLTVLFHVLSSEVDPAARLVELIPVDGRVKKIAARAVTKGVRGVFVSCFKLASFHAAFTWITFRFFGVRFVYTGVLLSGLTAFLPLLASWSVALPAALSLAAKGRGLRGAGLVLAHWVTVVFVDVDIYQTEIQTVHPYIVGLSVVGGMCVFQPAVQGAVLGPLLVTALATGHALYQELVRPPPAAARAEAAARSGGGSPRDRERKGNAERENENGNRNDPPNARGGSSDPISTRKQSEGLGFR
jgi:hypothetical protein